MGLHGTVRKGSQGFPKDLVAFGKQWKKGEWAVQHAMYGVAHDAKILVWTVMDSDLVMGISSCAAVPAARPIRVGEYIKLETRRLHRVIPD